MGIRSRNQNFPEQQDLHPPKGPQLSLGEAHLQRTVSPPFLPSPPCSQTRVALNPNQTCTQEIKLSSSECYQDPQMVILDAPLVVQPMYPLNCLHWSSWSGDIITSQQTTSSSRSSCVCSHGPLFYMPGRSLPSPCMVNDHYSLKCS